MSLPPENLFGTLRAHWNIFFSSRGLWTWASVGGRQKGICPPLEIETKNENFLEKLKLAAQFWSIDLISCNGNLCIIMTLALHASQVHCFGVMYCYDMVLCSDELADHSCPLLCLQRQVVKLASGLLYCRSLLRNNNMATNLHRFTSSNGRKCFATCDC